MKKRKLKFKVGKLYSIRKDGWYYQETSSGRDRGFQVLYTSDEEIIRKDFPDAKSDGRSIMINLKENPILILVTNYDSTGDARFCKILTGEQIGWTFLRGEEFVECFTELRVKNEV